MVELVEEKKKTEPVRRTSQGRCFPLIQEEEEVVLEAWKKESQPSSHSAH